MRAAQLHQQGPRRFAKHAHEGERMPCCRADRTMYAVHPIPLAEVAAVRKHAPSFGTQHIVLVLANGLTLPPLYFTRRRRARALCRAQGGAGVRRVSGLVVPLLCLAVHAAAAS